MKPGASGVAIRASAAALAIACAACTQPERPGVRAGERFPEIRLARLDGEGAIALPGAAGSLLVVNVWATWCEPCRRELPQLLALERPRVVLISLDDGWPVVRHFFEGNVPDSVMLDVEGGARTAFGVTTLPDSYLIGRGGRPIARFQGARAWSSSAARSELARLLQND